ncbi:MAG: hypothetical protein P8Y45_17485, partial [Exilibacterium sp.]
TARKSMKGLPCAIPIISMGMQVHGRTVKNAGVSGVQASTKRTPPTRKTRLNIELPYYPK